MTATPDEATHTEQVQEDQVNPIDSHTIQDQDEDVTVRPNGFLVEQQQHVQSIAQDVPSTLPVLRVSTPGSPDVTSDSEFRASSPQSSYTHTEITTGISDRSSRRRSIMDVSLSYLS